VKKGQSENRMRMKKAIEDEEYVKWIFMLGDIIEVREADYDDASDFLS
jgi:hypothetical protein